jgi:ribosomal protein L20
VSTARLDEVRAAFLADLAVRDPQAFTQIVELSQQAGG